MFHILKNKPSTSATSGREILNFCLQALSVQSENKKSEVKSFCLKKKQGKYFLVL